MKNTLDSMVIGLALLAGVHKAAGLPATNTPAAIPWNQIGAKAGADYKGDGLAVSPTAQGANLRCDFQRLDGEATPKGLWLTSTATNSLKDRFRVVAVAVGRVTPGAADRTPNIHHSTSNIQLEDEGSISLDGQTVRFSRPGLVEEYSVSMDGVRQDFVVPERPAGAGELEVRLAVSGARVEPSPAGVRLALNNSGRKLAYSRLRVTDATGKELAARIEVTGKAGSPLPAAMGGDSDSGAHGVTRPTLVLVVNDAAAVYPVRIDPTFSDANWSSMGGIPGTDGDVNATAVDSAGDIYIGGDFIGVSDIIANHIAKWDGSRWSALGSGINGSVSALAVSSGTLFAGGSFTSAGGISANNIAQWDGSRWSALDSGMDTNDYVYALAVSGNELYAGGYFATAGGIAANNIAKWDRNSWSALGSGIPVSSSIFDPYPGVYALAVSGSDLYAGGDFDMAGGSAANNIAKWDGSSWSALGSGMSGGGPYGGPNVNALAVSGSNVYAGGEFTTAGGNSANYIAKWDGSSWSALGSGISGVLDESVPDVYALAVSGSNVYVGGWFTTAGGSPASCIAKWNGSSWSALGSGVGYLWVTALAVSGSDVYAGGEFTTAGGSTANYIAKWDGDGWSEMGPGIDGFVQALAASGSNVYVGGEFTIAGGILANYIAMWNGSKWSALDSGLNDVVYCLAASGSNVYVGGGFTTAGGILVNSIAKWDGSSWSALGSGTDGAVTALAVSGNDLYAGGIFTTAGGSTVNCIAKWNGNSWSEMGAGISGAPEGDASYVAAVAVSGNNVYAGGYFTVAGGVAANNIAKWNGSSWSHMGAGIGNADYGVAALAASGSDVYAGAEFTVSKWDGNSWSDLDSGEGLLGSVYALAVSGSNVYAGGAYTTDGDGNPEPNIAEWDGNSWSLLGSGMNASVDALAVSGNDLYAGGEFTKAGGKVSLYMARAVLCLPSLTLRQTTSSAVAISWPSPSPGFVLQQNTDSLGSGNWSNVTDSILNDGTNKMITQPMGRNSFFRLVLP